MTSPHDLHTRGVSALNRGRHREARRLLERAREEAGEAADADLDARIAGSLAYVLSETGEHDAAMALCREALGRSGLDRHTEGILHAQLGLLQMLRGETAAAMADLDAASRLMDDPTHLARIHLNRGNVHLQRKQLPEALAGFEQSHMAYRQVGDEYGAAKAVHNLGYVHFLEGDLVAALRRLDEAYPSFEAEGPVMTAMADQDRAEVLMAAGLYEQGATALAAAADAYGRRRLHQRRGEAELALALKG
ncbi:tetratricopeptide repeat protein, partial [Nocardioides hankookensis]